MGNRSINIVEIRKIMIEQGYNTIGSLSEVSKINRATLGRILTGQILPSSQTMYKLVESLKISPEIAGEIFFTINLRNK